MTFLSIKKKAIEFASKILKYKNPEDYSVDGLYEVRRHSKNLQGKLTNQNIATALNTAKSNYNNHPTNDNYLNYALTVSYAAEYYQEHYKKVRNSNKAKKNNNNNLEKDLMVLESRYVNKNINKKMQSFKDMFFKTKTSSSSDSKSIDIQFSNSETDTPSTSSIDSIHTYDSTDTEYSDSTDTQFTTSSIDSIKTYDSTNTEYSDSTDTQFTTSSIDSIKTYDFTDTEYSDSDTDTDTDTFSTSSIDSTDTFTTSSIDAFDITYGKKDSSHSKSFLRTKIDKYPNSYSVSSDSDSVFGSDSDPESREFNSQLYSNEIPIEQTQHYKYQKLIESKEYLDLKAYIKTLEKESKDSTHTYFCGLIDMRVEKVATLKILIQNIGKKSSLLDVKKLLDTFYEGKKNTDAQAPYKILNKGQNFTTHVLGFFGLRTTTISRIDDLYKFIEKKLDNKSQEEQSKNLILQDFK